MICCYQSSVLHKFIRQPPPMCPGHYYWPLHHYAANMSNEHEIMAEISAGIDRYSYLTQDIDIQNLVSSLKVHATVGRCRN